MDTITIRQFVNRYKVRAQANWADSNPNMTDMVSGSSHWRVTLRVGRRQLTVPFSQGPAISGEPTADDVLNCLAMDASGFANAQNFENWASEYGYDSDSRKAERTYKAVARQTEGLRRLLEPSAFETLLYHTESL